MQLDEEFQVAIYGNNTKIKPLPLHMRPKFELESDRLSIPFHSSCFFELLWGPRILRYYIKKAKRTCGTYIPLFRL